MYYLLFSDFYDCNIFHDVNHESQLRNTFVTQNIESIENFLDYKIPLS